MSVIRLVSVLALAAGFAAPVSAALFKVWIYQHAVQLGYRLSEREEARRRLGNELRQLEVELAAERSPPRLAELARRLGLEPPVPEQVFALRRSGPPSAPARGIGQPSSPSVADAARPTLTRGHHGSP